VRDFAGALVKLAHGCGWKVVAEGIDDARDLGALWSLGFDGATGRAVGAAGEPGEAGEAGEAGEEGAASA
jgi:EAL domain-containing protein (putative c-di-GMP-specific phosphodiesterase class I)